MELLIPQIDATEGFLFSIVPGERALLLGPNGAGKSRLGAYIESELSKNIIQNNTNNTTRNDNNDYSIEQQITEKSNKKLNQLNLLQLNF